MTAACGSGEKASFYSQPVVSAGQGSSSAGDGATSGAGGAGQAGTATGGGGGVLSGGTTGSGGDPGAAGLAGSAGAAAGMSGGAGLGGAGGDAGAGGGKGDKGGQGGKGSEAGAGQGGMAERPPVSCTAHGADAESFDGHCYLFVSEATTFDDAVEACEDRDAHLATISSAGRTRAEFDAENLFVWELGGAVPVWIGATDGRATPQPGDGTFYSWLTDEPMDFDAWSPGQPNNSPSSCEENTSCSCDQGACYEHCAFIWATAAEDTGVAPGWNDRLCDHQIGFVCEWDE